ncbi:MAG: GrpB family protein [Bacteroidetes bacterium]|nr:GrpB family protein [Bacteroidota bacterium]
MKITVEEYNNDWPNKFSEEQLAINNALLNFSPTIEHIGSTSVVGLGAKPTIDILVGLKDKSHLDEVINPMINCGYTYFKLYEPSWPSRRLFVKLTPLKNLVPPKIIGIGEEYIGGKDFKSLANIHIIVKDTYDWTRHIAFRDFLNTYPEIKDKYYKLKKNLSEQEFKHQFEYSAAKDSFIKETEKLALTWFHKQSCKNNSH